MIYSTKTSGRETPVPSPMSHSSASPESQGWTWSSSRVVSRAASTSDVVEQVFREAQDAGIQGTPTFFINGQILAGAQSLEAFEQVIEEELAKAGGQTEGA